MIDRYAWSPYDSNGIEYVNGEWVKWRSMFMILARIIEANGGQIEMPKYTLLDIDKVSIVETENGSKIILKLLPNTDKSNYTNLEDKNNV